MKKKFILLLIFWPWVLIFFEFIIITIANIFGCSISAAGPSPCNFLGLVDLGGLLYPLWSVGYQIAFSLFWILPAIGIWLLTFIVLKFHGSQD